MGLYDLFTTPGFYKKDLDSLKQIQYYAKRDWYEEESVRGLEGLGFLDGVPMASHTYLDEEEDIFLRIWQVSESYEQSKVDIADFIARQVGRQNLIWFYGNYVSGAEIERPDGLTYMSMDYSFQDQNRRVCETFILDGEWTVCRARCAYPLNMEHRASRFWGGLTLFKGNNYFANSIIINDKDFWRK